MENPLEQEMKEMMQSKEPHGEEMDNTTHSENTERQNIYVQLENEGGMDSTAVQMENGHGQEMDNTARLKNLHGQKMHDDLQSEKTHGQKTGKAVQSKISHQPEIENAVELENQHGQKMDDAAHVDEQKVPCSEMETETPGTVRVAVN